MKGRRNRKTWEKEKLWCKTAEERAKINERGIIRSAKMKGGKMML
jgi:hypothetical protein